MNGGIVTKVKIFHPRLRGLVMPMLCVLVPVCLASQAVPAGDANRVDRARAPVAGTTDSETNTATRKPHDDSFVIGNDDLLSISVWKEPDISRSVPVRSDGRISLPLAGELQAAGRTPLQLENDIAGKLKDYVSEPEVTVIVQEIKSQRFNVLGQVARPGSYSLAQASTILDAVALAGGFRDFAKQKSIYVLRQNPDGREARIRFNYKDVIKGKNPAQNIKLQAHDTIVVP